MCVQFIQIEDYLKENARNKEIKNKYERELKNKKRMMMENVADMELQIIEKKEETKIIILMSI